MNPTLQLVIAYVLGFVTLPAVVLVVIAVANAMWTSDFDEVDL